MIYVINKKDMKKTVLLLTILMCGLSSKNHAQFYVTGDLQVNVTLNATHDSTNCSTQASQFVAITKNNSYLGEVIQVKDPFSGSVYQSFTNTAGDLTYNCFFPGFPMMTTDNNVSGGWVNLFFPPMKVTSTNDTVLNINNMAMFPVSNPCEYGTVDGLVYVDNNSDCIYNSGDVTLNGVNVYGEATINTGTNSGFASTNVGNYNLQLQKSWMTNYTISIPSIYDFIFPLSSCQASTFSSSVLPASNVNFALECGGNIDVQSGVLTPNSVRPLIPFVIYPYVSNIGCDVASGQLKLILDNNLVYSAINITNPANSVSGDTLIWNYTNLSSLSSGAFWNSFFSGIYLTPNATINIGDTVCFQVMSTIMTNDLNPSNNVYTVCLPVVNSYDPNIKSVEPKGLGLTGDIAASTNAMKYKIEFQNTGNAPAFNITVKDTLDGDFDLTTFKILGASHQMTPVWLANNVVSFQYNNINLPDSLSDEPHSHGYVQYSIQQLPGLSIGTKLKNTAYIYFDANPAIVTNTTLNTIANVLNLSEVESSGFMLYPNPANSELNFEMLTETVTSVVVRDVLGRTMFTDSYKNSKFSIDTREFSNGICFVTTIQNGNSITNSVMIAH